MLHRWGNWGSEASPRWHSQSRAKLGSWSQMCLLNYQPGTNEAASITTPLHPSRPTCTDLEQQLLVPRFFWLHLPPWERGKPEGHPGTDCSSKRWSEVRTGPSASQSFFSLFSLTKTQTGALYQSRGAGWGRRWDRGSRGRGYMYTYGWFMLRFDRKQQNYVKQLSFNKKIN